jgi:CHAD domain-containing protein
MAKNNRIEIRADDKFIETIEELSTRTRKTRADVIREALSLYMMALNEKTMHNRGIVFKELTESPKKTMEAKVEALA